MRLSSPFDIMTLAELVWRPAATMLDGRRAAPPTTRGEVYWYCCKNLKAMPPLLCNWRTLPALTTCEGCMLAVQSLPWRGGFGNVEWTPRNASRTIHFCERQSEVAISCTDNFPFGVPNGVCTACRRGIREGGHPCYLLNEPTKPAFA